MRESPDSGGLGFYIGGGVRFSRDDVPDILCKNIAKYIFTSK